MRKQPLASIMMTMMMMVGGSSLSFLSVVVVVVDAAASTTTTTAGSPPKIDLSSFSNINISSVSSVSSSASASASSQSNNNIIEVDMGRMVMQLRSSVDSDTTELQNEMKLLTTNYLNSYFSSYYKTFAPEQPPNNPTTRKQQQDEDGGGDGGDGGGVTVEIETNVGKDAPDSDSNVTTSSDDAQAVEDYFAFVNIAVGSFGVHGVDGSFISTLEFAGNVVFRYDPAPSQPFITTLMRNAFQGANEQLFIGHLLKSNKLQFLQELTHIIIELDNTAVVETALDENHNIMEGNGEGNGPQQQQEGPVVSSSSNDSQEASSRTSALDWLKAQDRWAEILLYVAAGCIGLVALLCCFSFLRCCCFNPNRSKVVLGGGKQFIANGVVVDDDEPIAVKTVEVPMAKSRGSSSVDPTAIYRKSSSSSSKGGYYNRDGWKKTRKSSSSSATTSSSYRRSTYPAPHYDDSLLDQLERAPPSPDRSISSQDSSTFSYSDNMSACTSSKASVASGTSSRFSIGSTVSRFSMDMPSIDLGAWQSAVRGNTVIPATTSGNNVPFGHDISAIGKSDLGIIQEESNDEELVRRNDSRGSNCGSSNEDPDGIHSSSSRRGLTKSSSAYRNKKKGHHNSRRSISNREPKEEFADISLQSDSSDVIADLRNLSIQIKRQAVRKSAVEP